MNAKYTTYKLPVNWENGMMINQAHLNEMNDYMLSVYRNSMLNGLHKYNYGLLPNYDSKFDSLDITLEKQGNNLFAQIEQCHLLTFDGFCFSINTQILKDGTLEYNDFNLSIDLDTINNNYILLYLSYNPTEQIKAGAIDVDKDDFERKPFLNFKMKLNSSNLESINQVKQFEAQGNSIPLAVVNITNKDNPVLEKKYIPPCINFYSDARLSEIFEKIKRDNNELLENMSQVMSFVHEDSKENLVENLTLDLGLIIKNVLPIVAEINAAFRTKLKVSGLIELLFLYKKMATTFMASVDSLEQSSRRELGKYFAEMHGTPHELTKIGLELVDVDYVHVNMYNTCLKPVMNFVNLILNLMKDMASKGLQTTLFSNSSGYQERRRRPAREQERYVEQDDDRSNQQNDRTDQRAQTSNSPQQTPTPQRHKEDESDDPSPWI